MTLPELQPYSTGACLPEATPELCEVSHDPNEYAALSTAEAEVTSEFGGTFRTPGAFRAPSAWKIVEVG